jgi:hypothetical protein
MKAKQTITASAAFAALAMAWWRRHTTLCAREAQFDEKCMEEALSTFEGEGGIVT